MVKYSQKNWISVQMAVSQGSDISVSALSHIICGSFQGTLQQFVDDFFRSVLCSGAVVPPAVKYFFDFLDEQALKHDVDEETIHIWKTNR